MGHLLTIAIAVIAGCIVFTIVRTMIRFKGQIDKKLSDIGPLKHDESIHTVVNKVLGRHVDPKSYKDPIALKTSWSPAKKGGSTIITHELVYIDASRIEFQASKSAKVFPMLLIVVGIGLPTIFSAKSLINGTFSLTLMTVPPILAGLFLLMAAGILWYLHTSPIVFDKSEGYFWKGRTAPQKIANNNTLSKYTHLEDIHALQLISETCWRNEDRSYRSHELNLVLKDGTRINVVDHGVKKNIYEYTCRLSQFLEIPVWDALAE
jgi:hypothetical protein